jgi:hypothetical protein
VNTALQIGRVRPDPLVFAEKASTFEAIRSLVRRVENAKSALEVHRTSQACSSLVNFARRVIEALNHPST